METLALLEKLIITQSQKRQNARVIGSKIEKDGTITYMLEPVRVDFSPFTNGAKMMKINSKDIENKTVCIEKHIV